MDTLPPEVLCQIFLKSLPYRPLSGLDALYQASISVPICISHVCRSWRSTSLSYGKLWSCLRIKYNASISQNRRKMLRDIFDTWLSRTNGSPISYAFVCPLNGDADKEDHRRAEYMIATLLSCQHWWKNVAFAWKGIELSADFPELNLTNMPLLESLVFDVELPIRADINVEQSSRWRSLAVHGK